MFVSICYANVRMFFCGGLRRQQIYDLTLNTICSHDVCFWVARSDKMELIAPRVACFEKTVIAPRFACFEKRAIAPRFARLKKGAIAARFTRFEKGAIVPRFAPMHVLGPDCCLYYVPKISKYYV